MSDNIKCVRKGDTVAINLIGLHVQVLAGDGKYRTGTAQRQTDSWEIKTFWRFVNGCIHG